ncbi:MAG: hypothetical protein HY754_08985 [Nitrospirae bacterium]|nr:hypothetical protein [Nitrospirota bacterium]
MRDSIIHLKRIMLIISLTFIAYSNSFYSEFHFDDYSSIITHPYVKSVKNISDFFYSDGKPLVNRPVTMATFALNYKIGGFKPPTYHYINFFIHLSNVILVYWFVTVTLTIHDTRYTIHDSRFTIHDSRSTIHDKDNTPLCHPLLRGELKGGNVHHVSCIVHHSFVAFLSSLMFALHPIQTQAVTYIAQRAEILSTFFYLLSLIMYIKFRTHDTKMMHDAGYTIHDKDNTPLCPPLLRGELKGGIVHRASWIMYLGSLLSAVLAIGAKEIAVTLPVTILLYDVFFISDRNIKTLLRQWPIYILFLTTLFSAMYFMGISQIMNFVSAGTVKSPPTPNIYAGLPFISRYEYLFTQFRVLWTYIKLLILPIDQNVDYNYPVSTGLLNPITTLVGGIGIIMLLISAMLLFNRQRFLSFFILWFFLLLSPTSSVAVLPDVIFEHRLYLPSLGYFIIFAMGVYKVTDIISRSLLRGSSRKFL